MIGVRLANINNIEWFMSKKIGLSLLAILAVVFLIAFGLFSMPSREVQVTHLPWQINAEDGQKTQVMLLNIGRDNLSTVTEGVRKIPEIAVFRNPAGEYLIEAYFSKVKRGPLQGSLAAEVDIEGVDLAGYAKFDKQGKPMPSGKRKFVLSKMGILEANKLRVWKLAYLPSTNYSATQIEQFFGKPESKKTVTAEIERWFYPAKGLVITYDQEGREVFYYSARKEYVRLVDSLPVQPTQHSIDKKTR